MARPDFPVNRTPTPDEMKFASLVHLGAWIGQFVYCFNFIVPLFAFLVTDSEFVREHAREELNFQISMFIWLVISVFACIVIIGIVGLVVFPIMMLICPLIAFSCARFGGGYRFPFTFRFV